MSDERKQGQSGAERITLAISALVLVVILSIATWSHVSIGNGPAEITIETHTEDIRRQGDLWYLPITITNSGGRTAQDVVVLGSLTVGEEDPEEVEVTIAFLAGGESERAELIFTTDPREGEFSLHATSFLVP